MKIRDVLARKAMTGVATISDKETLGTLARLLKEKSIGAMIVTNTGRDVAGVISERDVVRAIGQGGAACLNDPLGRHMTIDVKMAALDDSVEHLLDEMTKGRFRHMPVMEQGEMIGVVSIGDLVKAQIHKLHTEKAALEEYVRS